MLTLHAHLGGLGTDGKYSIDGLHVSARCALPGQLTRPRGTPEMGVEEGRVGNQRQIRWYLLPSSGGGLLPRGKPRQVWLLELGSRGGGEGPLCNKPARSPQRPTTRLYT